MRFAVAFTFTKSHRDFLRVVADALAAELGKDRVLFDEYHREELSTPQGGITLLEWYKKESQLVVVAVSSDYNQPDSWTYFEWPQVLASIVRGKDAENVLLLQMDDTLPHEIAGLSDMAFALNARSMTAEAVAAEIQKRLTRIRGRAAPDAGRHARIRPIQSAHSSVSESSEASPVDDALLRGFQPPSYGAQMHARRALTESIAETLISGSSVYLNAPSGFGKSVLLSQLTSKNPVWIDCGQEKNDFMQLRQHLSAFVAAKYRMRALPDKPRDIARALDSIVSSGPQEPLLLLVDHVDQIDNGIKAFLESWVHNGPSLLLCRSWSRRLVDFSAISRCSRRSSAND